jgi:hypothetical protein
MSSEMTLILQFWMRYADCNRLRQSASDFSLLHLIRQDDSTFSKK